MTGLEALLALFATDKMVDAAIAGFIGNRTDSSARFCYKFLYRHFAEDPNNPRNHDVLLAVQSAYVRSLQCFAQQCYDRFRGPNGNDEERWAASRLKEVAAGLDARRPLPAWAPAMAQLETDAQALFTPAGGLDASITLRSLAALEAATGALPDSITTLFRHGDAHVRSWPDNFRLLFAEQVKTNPRVAAITSFAGLAELKARGFDLAARVAQLQAEATTQSAVLMGMRDLMVSFWQEIADQLQTVITQLGDLETNNQRRHAEQMAANAALMAALERRERTIELRITENPADEQLLRNVIAELRIRQPDADLATILGNIPTALAERDALKAELESLRADDNRIAGLVQAAETAISAGELPKARALIDEAIAVHAEREADARRQRARLLAVRARTFILQLDYRAALAGLDAAAATTPEAREQFDFFWDAANLADEWAGKLPDPAAPLEAVQRWQALVARSDSDSDAERRASLQNNLANALSILGERQKDPATLQAAITAYRAALNVHTQAALPLKWAATQNNLGNALRALGERQGDPATLQEAIAAYRAALSVYTQAALPLEWAGTQNNLGNALRTLGERQDDPETLQEAIAAYRAALSVRTQAALPLEWAMTRNNLGNALLALGERRDDPATLQDAIAAYRAALSVHTQAALPLEWARTQNNLGNALCALGERQDDPATLRDAIAAYRAALSVYTQTALPLDWAATQNNLGTALQALGERQGHPATLRDAIAAYRAALGVRTQAALPLDWAMTQNNLGNALQALGEHQGHPATLRDAIAAFEAALTVFAKPGLDYFDRNTSANRDRARAALARLGG